MSNTSVAYAAGLVLLAATYCALGSAALTLDAVLQWHIGANWALSGFAVAVVIAFGARYLPAVFLGALLVHGNAGVAIPVALGIALSNSLEALLAAALTRRFAGKTEVRLDRLRDVAGLVLLGAMLSAAAGATFATASFWAGGVARDLGAIWLSWCIGDAVGILVLTPFLLAFGEPAGYPRNAAYYLEALAIMLMVAVVGGIVFGPAFLFPHNRHPLAFVFLPLIFWAAVRYEVRGAAGTMLLLAGITIIGTAKGYGPFAQLPHYDGLLVLAVFNGVGAITGLVAAASAADRRQSAGLREGLELLQQVVHLLPVGVWVADRQGRVSSANPAAARVWAGGAASNAYRGWGGTRRSRIEARELPLERAIENGETTVKERVELHAIDGAQKMLLVSASPLLDSKQAQIGAVTVAEDVTEMVRGEQALRELATIVQQADDIVYVTARDGAIEYVNPSFEKVTGFAAEEAVGRTPRILKSGRQDNSFYANLWNTILSGKPFRGVVVNRKKSGELYHEAKTISPIRNAEGEITHFVSTGKDVTERERAADLLRKLTRLYAVLSGINSTILRVRERDELFHEACRIAVEAGKFPLAWIGVVDRDAMEIRPAAWHGAEQGLLEIARRTLTWRDETLRRRMPVRAVTEKRTYVSNDVENDPEVLFKEELLTRGIRSHAMLPILVSGEAVALFVLCSAEVGFFDDEEVKLLEELAGDIAFAYDHLEKEKRLNYLAYYDSLTGLANRTLFHERLDQALRAAARAEGKLAVLALNIDRFKNINDSLGRQIGDALLRQIAERVSGCVGGPNLVARVSADSFAVLLPEVKAEDQVARTVEEELRSCFGSPFRLDGQELRISAKIGIALFPNDGADADTLFKNAEAALKKAKTSGEQYLFFAKQMTERVAEKLALENKLRQALETGEFVLHYQPVVDIETGRISGMEALIRWMSPELGLVPPMDFIPLMEETGLILEVGAWALHQAVLDYAYWVEQGMSAPRVAVNVSPIQLRKRDFVAVVDEALKRGTAPIGIVLEITESLIMEDIEENIEKLRAIRALGVSVAVDDFGTGHSSLGYLARLPVESLKIDRSFIITMANDPNAMTLVSTIITLAHSLNLKVVAEGVDSEEQAKFLRLLRCDQMQGYLFSRPLPRENMTALLKQGQAPGAIPG